jgi:tetratricopeptide (TPR) repeat protein
LVLVISTIGTLLIAHDRQRHPPVAISSAHARTAIPAGVTAEAYDLYLKGVQASGHLSSEGFRTGVEYFEKAIASQPDFAAAYAALADTQVQFLFTGPLAPRDVIPKAEAAAHKALQLDDTLANAHNALGTILQMFYWRWEEGDREFRRARELGGGADPSTSVVSLIRLGRYNDAIAEAERALRQDPLSFGAQVNVGLARRAAGDYEVAVATLRRAIQNTSSQPRGHFQLGITLVAMGRLREGIYELETAAAASRGHTSRFKAYLGYGYAMAGRRTDARAILSELDSRARHEYVSAYGKALILDALGDKEAALAALARAYDDRAMEFAQATQYPPFRTIARDPRYEAIVQRVGLPAVTTNPNPHP